ncbi:NlpC/P60 family protein [Citromicrobium bathyomarinum]|uniref:NlpC/P60 family protein n=1 Tax=Citromicrobium bathyomarinum TaxID=72174 RepID=UPI003159FA0A
MERNIALATAAGELAGTPFRLQGRDPAHGLDCIGLVLVSLARIGIELHLPADYRPRRRRFEIPDAALQRAGLASAPAPYVAGDILLLRTAPVQVHLGIVRDAGWVIHAHAGLGRVVAQPLSESWAVAAAWRFVTETVPKGDIEWPR